MLNIDWFQPYVHTISSVGVIYLTVPCTLRFRLENRIIIPGPSEPTHDIGRVSENCRSKSELENNDSKVV